MQPSALIESADGRSQSSLPETPSSSVAHVNRTSRSNETIGSSPTSAGSKRLSWIHLGTGIRVTKDIVQTVHVLPESSKSGPSSAKHRLSQKDNKEKQSSNIRKMDPSTPSTNAIREMEDHICPSPVIHPERSADSLAKQRPQRPRSALLLTPTPAFEESPGFAAHYNNVDGNVAARRQIPQRRRSTSEEQPIRTNKPIPRDAKPQRGNTNDLILFFQGQRISLDTESFVTPEGLLCGSGTGNPINGIKAASHKFSQFVNPKPVTVLSVTNPTREDIAQGQKKAKVTTKLYLTKRTSGKPKKMPMEVHEKTDVLNGDGNFEGLVDLNAAEKSALDNDCNPDINQGKQLQHQTDEEKWEKWHRYIGHMGSADKFTEQVHAAMSGGLIGSGNLKPSIIPVSKHDLLDITTASNLKQDDGNAYNNIDLSQRGLGYSNNENVVLTASKAPRRKGVSQSSLNDSKQDLEQPTSPTPDRSESRSSDYPKSSNHHATSSVGSASFTGPATHPIAVPPRTSSRASSRPSSRNENQSVRKTGSSLTLSNDQPSHILGYQSSNEALASHKKRTRDGPSGSTSTLSVIESQAIPYTPPQSPRSNSSMTFDSNHYIIRASTPNQYQPKTKAPTEPPMGPLPELPEGHDRSNAPSRTSYRSKRSSRQTQTSHGRNNTSLTSISSSGARSPQQGYRPQDSPGKTGSFRSSVQQPATLSQLDTSSINPMSVRSSHDIRSPESIKSQDSETSTAARSTRAERVRARKLRDTASIRARNENRALEERTTTGLVAAEKSPHLDQFPAIPLTLPSNQGRNTPPQPSTTPSNQLRRRASFMRNNSFTIRQTLSRSPIFIVAESDPRTSKFRTACRSQPSTPTTSSSTHKLDPIPTIHSMTTSTTTTINTQPSSYPIKPQKSERSIHSKTSITRNGAQTPPHSESSLQSSDDENHHQHITSPTKTMKRHHNSKPSTNLPQTLSSSPHHHPSREDILEQRISRLEIENRKYLAMIVAWLDPSKVLEGSDLTSDPLARS